MRVVGALIGAYLRSLLNAFTRGSRGQRIARALGAIAALLVWWGLFVGTRGAIGLLVENVSIADQVVVKGLEVLLLVMFGAMTYSAVLVALVHLFLSDDLRFLAFLPATDTQLFVVKGFEVVLISSWAPLFFGGAVLAGIGSGMSAPWAFYPTLAAVMTLFVMVPSCLAMGLTSIAANLFPANRSRDVLVFLSLLFLLAVFVVIRSMQPERILDPAAVEELSFVLTRLNVPAGGYLPSTWATRVLASTMTQASGGWTAAALLLSAAGASAGFGLVCFRKLFRRGLSMALTSRGRLMSSRSFGARVIERLTAMLPRTVGAIVRKDLLAFGRDPSQWSQLLLLGALVMIYVLNVRVIPLDQMNVIGLTPEQAADIFGFGNLLFIGFVLTAVGLRFCFSTVSLEGRAAWVVLTAPVRARTLLMAKLVPGLGLLWGYGAVLVIGTNWLLQPSRPVVAVTAVAMTLIALGLGGLGVGLGAMMPRFSSENPARIAMSAGGLMYMFGGMSFSVIEVLLLAYPTYVWATGEPGNGPIMLFLLTLSVLTPAAVLTAPMLAGADRVGRAEL